MSTSREQIAHALDHHVQLAMAGSVDWLVAPAALAAAPGAAVPTAMGQEAESAAAELAAMQRRMANCQRCGLCETRQSVVFGCGDSHARLMFVGEGPGADEDRSGEPFVGRAGQLLDRMIGAMGLSREAVYITNVVKCRPPNNRNPLPEEMAACMGALRQQIDLVQPEVIVALGRVAASALLARETSIGAARGRDLEAFGRPLIVTYHPAYLLRTPADKGKAWEDLQGAMRLLGLTLPG